MMILILLFLLIVAVLIEWKDPPKPEPLDLTPDGDDHGSEPNP